MKPSDRAKVIEELEWLCDHPGEVYGFLTEEERRSIVKQGFVTTDLWKALMVRVPKSMLMKEAM